MADEQHIIKQFHASADLKQQAAKVLAPNILRAAKQMIQALSANKHVFACGNGGSACDAQHLAAELVNRFELERQALPAMALTTDTAILTSVANDANYQHVFARQLEAWGKQGDILVAITTSGRSKNVVQAIKTATQLEMHTVVFSGGDGGDVAGLLGKNDIEIRVPAQQTARIQEVHLLVIHCICDLIDAHFAS